MRFFIASILLFLGGCATPADPFPGLPAIINGPAQAPVRHKDDLTVGKVILYDVQSGKRMREGVLITATSQPIRFHVDSVSDVELHTAIAVHFQKGVEICVHLDDGGRAMALEPNKPDKPE